jgi:hypothetical protein
VVQDMGYKYFTSACNPQRNLSIENNLDLVVEALSHLLGNQNYPVLIHSNKGKHRWSSVQATPLIGSGVVIEDGVWPVFSTNMIVTLKGKVMATYSYSSYQTGSECASLLKPLTKKSNSIPNISQPGCHEQFLQYII